MRRRLAPFGLAVLLVLAAAPARPASIPIDQFSEVLPANDCLIDSHRPVVFAGELCDGSACPPGTTRSGSCNEASQSALAGVLSPQRTVLTDGAPGSTSVVAEVLDASGLLEVSSSPGTLPLVSLDYTWDLATGYDLVGHGVTAVEFEAGGTISPEHPAGVTVFMGSEFAAIQTHVVLTAPGPVSLPLSTFDTQDPAFNSRKFVELMVIVEPELNRTTPTSAGHVTIGNLAFGVGAPVPTRQRSWAQVKSIYR